MTQTAVTITGSKSWRIFCCSNLVVILFEWHLHCTYFVARRTTIAIAKSRSYTDVVRTASKREDVTVHARFYCYSHWSLRIIWFQEWWSTHHFHIFHVAQTRTRIKNAVWNTPWSSQNFCSNYWSRVRTWFLIAFLWSYITKRTHNLSHLMFWNSFV